MKQAIMLSLKLISTSLRGVSAKISNQFGAVASAPVADLNHQSNNCKLSSLSQDTKLSQDYRPFSISSVSQASSVRTSRRNDIPADLVDVNLPEKPKKPVTPWISFVRERKDEVLRRKAKMTAAELAVILAREWKQMDKTKYEQEYKAQQEQYKNLIEHYQTSLTADQLDLLEFQKNAKREAKASKLLRKTHLPVLPRNAANFYCQERSKQNDFKEQLKYKKSAQLFSEIFKEYKGLSDDEKAKYIEMQDEDRARFQHEFIGWYESVQTNENLTKAAREQANMLRDKFKARKYI